jgi:hypothetical protein
VKDIGKRSGTGSGSYRHRQNTGKHHVNPSETHRQPAVKPASRALADSFTGGSREQWFMQWLLLVTNHRAGDRCSSQLLSIRW